MTEKKEELLDYLQYKIPNYPYDKDKDNLFIEELIEDFPGIDHLEEFKKFRIWIFDTGIRIVKYRLIIRKWFKRVDGFFKIKNKKSIVEQQKIFR